MQNLNKLLKIFKLAFNTYNFELITEIIDYIGDNNISEAIPLLLEYLKEEESPSMKQYIQELIVFLGKEKINIKSTLPYRGDETTKQLTKQDRLALRLKAGLEK